MCVMCVMCVMTDDIWNTIFHDHLPVALGYVDQAPAPEPIVIGKGLEAVSEALERCKEGVSAQKVFVLLCSYVSFFAEFSSCMCL